MSLKKTIPLDELKTYLDTNKHLPEVPSAKEMEANGVNLKEMNLLLLKKVEELTLHLIDQDKMITKLQVTEANADGLEKMIEDLTRQLMSLEDRIIKLKK
jgi:hypothetical protein